MRELTSLEDLKIVLKKYNKIILKFYGDFCQPCKIIEPLVLDLEKKNTGIKFYSVNSENTNVSKVFEHFNVSSLPTFVAVENSKYQGKIVGSDANALIQFVKNLN